MSVNASNVSLSPVEMGHDVVVFPNAVLGKPPITPAGTTARKIVAAGRPVSLGDNVVIGCNAVIYEGVTIGRSSLIGDNAVIREGARIGEHSIVGPNVTVGPNVRIGNHSRVCENSHVTGRSIIEDHVFIGAGFLSSNDNSMNRNDVELRGCWIKSYARVANGCNLLPGITVGEDAFVGAGSVVTRDVPPRTVVKGCPARFFKDVPVEDRRQA